MTAKSLILHQLSLLGRNKAAIDDTKTFHRLVSAHRLIFLLKPKKRLKNPQTTLLVDFLGSVNNMLQLEHRFLKELHLLRGASKKTTGERVDTNHLSERGTNRPGLPLWRGE